MENKTDYSLCFLLVLSIVLMVINFGIMNDTRLDKKLGYNEYENLEVKGEMVDEGEYPQARSV